MKVITLFSVCLFFYTEAISQIPTGYYESINGQTGEELKIELHQIIRAHKLFSYEAVKQFIIQTDTDPNVADNVILFYTGRSQVASDFGTEPDHWNREHVWPKSHGFPNESDTAYTDFHHLRPSDASVNSNRSNKDFDNVEQTSENAEGEAPDTFTDDLYWEPRDEIKGDVARMMFYMDTRYNSSSLDLQLMDSQTFTNDPHLGVLYTLLEWHESDPVDQAEIDRNEAVYNQQENRNPFVDHPEFVSSIWGDTSEPIVLLNTGSFNRDFGLVESGNSKSQIYTINSHNLQSDISVSVESPFQVSLDGASWSQSITIAMTSGVEQSDDIHLRFTPVSEGVFEAEVIHSTTNGLNKLLGVRGEEGTVEILTIVEARQKSLGEAVLVTGVVIDQQNNSSNSRTIYDGTAGIVVRSFDSGNESAPLVEGDSVVVSGLLGDYNNLLQISESPITIDLISQNTELPEPQLVTFGDIDESFESELVRFNNVTFVSSGIFQGGGSQGNFMITDGSSQFSFRLGDSSHPLVAQNIPDNSFDLIGIIGQFQSDYQISPRSEGDLLLSEITGVSEFQLDELSLFPNPAKNILNIRSNNYVEYSVKVFDLSGNMLIKSQNSPAQIDISRLKKGLYILAIRTSKDFTRKKFLKK